MSQIKRMMEENENKTKRKLEGYRKKLVAEGNDEIDCPHCSEVLSIEDIEEGKCLHCGYDLLGNLED